MLSIIIPSEIIKARATSSCSSESGKLVARILFCVASGQVGSCAITIKTRRESVRNWIDLGKLAFGPAPTSTIAFAGDDEPSANSYSASGAAALPSVINGSSAKNRNGESNGGPS
jgi:hypothetical protein